MGRKTGRCRSPGGRYASAIVGSVRRPVDSTTAAWGLTSSRAEGGRHLKTSSSREVNHQDVSVVIAADRSWLGTMDCWGSAARSTFLCGAPERRTPRGCWFGRLDTAASPAALGASD